MVDLGSNPNTIPLKIFNMESKYKEGDIVIVKSKLDEGKQYFDYPYNFTSMMLERFGGKKVTISKVISCEYIKGQKDPFGYFIKEDECLFKWHSSMFEDPTSKRRKRRKRRVTLNFKI